MFDLGKVLITAGINHSLEIGALSHQDIQTIIIKHLNNIDDNKHPEDREANQEAINNNFGRILTVHNINDLRIYCITEGLGSPKDIYTTTLLTEEY